MLVCLFNSPYGGFHSLKKAHGNLGLRYEGMNRYEGDTPVCKYAETLMERFQSLS